MNTYVKLTDGKKYKISQQLTNTKFLLQNNDDLEDIIIVNKSDLEDNNKYILVEDTINKLDDNYYKSIEDAYFNNNYDLIENEDLKILIRDDIEYLNNVNNDINNFLQSYNEMIITNERLTEINNLVNQAKIYRDSLIKAIDELKQKFDNERNEKKREKLSKSIEKLNKRLIAIKSNKKVKDALNKLEDDEIFELNKIYNFSLTDYDELKKEEFKIIEGFVDKLKKLKFDDRSLRGIEKEAKDKLIDKLKFDEINEIKSNKLYKKKFVVEKLDYKKYNIISKYEDEEQDDLNSLEIIRLKYFISKINKENYEKYFNLLLQTSIGFISEDTKEEESRYVTIKNDFLDEIEKMIKTNRDYYSQVVESDAIAKSITLLSNGFILIFLRKTVFQRLNGAYFEYWNLTPLNLERYGIYNIYQKNLISDNCLINAFQHFGIENNKLVRLKYYVKKGHIPACKLQEIADYLNINISLKSDKRTKLYKCKNETNQIIKLGIIKDHYFLKEKTKINSEYIIDFKKEDLSEEIKEIYDKLNELSSDNIDIDYDIEEETYQEAKQKKINKLIKKMNDITIDSMKKKREKDFISSFKLVKYMLDNKECLKKINIKELDGYYYQNDLMNDDEELIIDDDDFKLFEFKPKKKINYSDVLFIDYETFKKNIKELKTIEIEYLLCADSISDKINAKEYFDKNNKKCGEIFFDDIIDKYDNNSNILIYVQNLGFDIRFIYKHLSYVDQYIPKGRLVLTMRGCYMKGNKKVFITFKDMLPIICLKLADYASTFKIQTEKEIMPYSLLTESNIIKRYIKKSLAKKELNDEDYKIFLENIEKWGLNIDDDKFDLLKYTSKYCLIDVKVLKEGYVKYKEMCKTTLDIDIDDHLTIASISDYYLKKNGCYDGVYSINGPIKRYLSKFVVGGRVMTCQNKMIHKKDCKISDFDARSLYPSAMHYSKGFIKGKPKLLTKEMIEQLNKDFEKNKINYDALYMTIKINKINRKLNIPIVNYKNEKGIRCFENKEDIITYVDKVTLEDLIEFQKIEYEIIKGVYFNDGFNNKIINVIHFLYNKRLEMKRIKSPAQLTYKLLLNNAYGKTIQKYIEEENVIIKSEDKLLNYVSSNYNNVNSFIKLYNNNNDNKGFYLVKKRKCLEDQFNFPHIGINVLSYSKRIMTRVTSICEYNNMIIYYTDTDSLHLNNEDIPILSKLYFDKYNVQLIGEEMGQFHSDFDEIYIEGKKIDAEYAVESLFLGKKCYIDKILYIEKKDNKEDINHYRYHIRLKGIPEYSIKNLCDKKHSGDYMKLYYDMYNNKELIFDLYDERRACFKFMDDFTIEKNYDFKRKVSFNNEKMIF